MRLHALTALIATALTATALSTAPARAADVRSFVVVNQNDSVSIQRVWTAAAGTKAPWDEADLSGPVRPGSSMTFTMGVGATCFMDIKVQFSDGYEGSFTNVNVCRADRVLAK